MKSKYIISIFVSVFTLSLVCEPLANAESLSKPAVDTQQNIQEGNIPLQAQKYLTADDNTKSYIFNANAYQKENGISKSQVKEVKSKVDQLNNQINKNSNMHVENGQFVNYITDEQVKNHIESQGQDTSAFDKSNNNTSVLEAAKKGGVTKVAVGKDGGINIYLSHAFAANILKSGVTGGATLLGSLGGLAGASAGAAASQFINAYTGKAIPKNGIIMYGKPHGKGKYTFGKQ